MRRVVVLAMVLICSAPVRAQDCAVDLCPGTDVCIPPEATIQIEYASGPHVLTAVPDGSGDRLEDLGISIRVRLVHPTRGPIAQLPASCVLLYNAALCSCSWMTAAGPTDTGGWTKFTGAFRGGGCVEYVTLFADGIALARIPLRINSPDTGTVSPCGVDGSDVAALAQKLGRPSEYSFCFDYNDDGFIDAGDVASFAQQVGANCQ